MPALARHAVDPRQQLILDHYPQVRAVAARLVRRLPAGVDFEELVHQGVLGLIDAIDRFDATRGVPFRAYAEIRIQGAMMDTLRRDDWVPRSVRRKALRLQQAERSLTRSLGHSPSRDDLAEWLGTTAASVDALRADTAPRTVLRFDAPHPAAEDAPLSDRIADDTEPADELLFGAHVREEIAAAINHLPEKERLVLTLSVMRGLTLREIGEVLGVTESRACQLRAQAVQRLRFRMRRFAA